MKLILTALMLFPLVGKSVETKKCPEHLQINFTGIEALSDAGLIKTGAERSYDEEESLRIMGPSRDLLKLAPKESYQNLRLHLVQKADAQCRYLPEGEHRQKGDNETRLVTKNGKNLLRVSLKVGVDYFWTYLAVTSYSPEEIKITPAKGTKLYGIFDHGSPSYHIAWAAKPTVEVATLNGSSILFVKIKGEEHEAFLSDVDEVSTEWADGNISTGRSSLNAIGISEQTPVETDEDLSNLSLSNFHDLFDYYVEEAVPQGTKFQTTLENLSPAVMKKVAVLLSEANAYAPENSENLKEFMKGIKKVSKHLGEQSDVKVLISRTRLENDDDERTLRNVSSVLLVNPKNRLALQIFTIEGTM